MSGQVIGAVVQLCVYAGIGYIIFRSVYRPKPKSITGKVAFRPGKEYSFLLGDNLYSYRIYGNYHGLEIRLPIEMPHIYLDSLMAGGRDVSVIFDKSQRVALEGSFDQYFNVFVPTRYEAVALSILSPDVMETLQKYAPEYDVEIYGDKLRIISNRKVLNRTDEQVRLMEVADKMLNEIEHRQRSWVESNSLQSIDQDLLMYASKGFRRPGGYTAWTRIWLSIFWLMCSLGFAVAGFLLILAGYHVLALLLFVFTVLVFVGLQLFTAKTQARERVWSRRS